MMRESLNNFNFNHSSLFVVSVNEIKMRILRISRFSFQPSNAHDASHQARLEREQARVRWLSLEWWNNSADAWRPDSKARGQQSQHQGGQRYQTIENWWVAHTIVNFFMALFVEYIFLTTFNGLDFGLDRRTETSRPKWCFYLKAEISSQSRKP